MLDAETSALGMTLFIVFILGLTLGFRWGYSKAMRVNSNCWNLLGRKAAEIEGYINKIRTLSKGFTLIELLIVLAVIGILALLIIPACSSDDTSPKRGPLYKCVDGKVYERLVGGTYASTDRTCLGEQ